MKTLYFIFISLMLVLPLKLLAIPWGIGYGGIQVPHYYGAGEYYEIIGPFPVFISMDHDNKRRDKRFYFEGAGDFRLAVNTEATTAPEPDKYSDTDTRITGFRNYTRRGMSHVPASLYLGVKIGMQLAEYSYIEQSFTPGVNLGSGWGHAGIIRKTKFHLGLINQVTHRLSLEFESIHGNDQYNDQYYTVKAGDAISGRSAYDGTKTGLVAFSAGINYYAVLGQMVFLAAFEYHDMSQSVIKDSPLVRNPKGYLLGLGFGIVF